MPDQMFPQSSWRDRISKRIRQSRVRRWLFLTPLLIVYMDFMAHIPYGSIECQWPLWALLLWYLLLSMASIWLHSRQLRRDRAPHAG